MKKKRGCFLITLSLILIAKLYSGKKNEIIRNKNKTIKKLTMYYDVLNRWIMIRNDGYSIKKYFTDNGYSTVAIYGMGELGMRLYDELIGSGILVKYVVDQNIVNIPDKKVAVVNKDETLEDVDVMIVTAVFAFNEIKQEIENKVKFPVVSLCEVIDDLCLFV